MLTSIFASTILMASEVTASYGVPPKGVKAAAAPSERVANRPWYVKAASDQIVNMCFWGGMTGGSGGYTTAGGAGAASSIYISSDYTETYETDTATTLYTTIPGAVVTVYNSDGLAATTTLDTTVSVVTDVPDSVSSDAADATPATTAPAENIRHGLVAEIRMIESYAHALAEAIIAPSSMTALLEDAYNAIMQRGYLHGTKAAELVQQASGALKQLETDPAYRSQRNALKAQPTPAHFNVKNIFETLSHTHSAGLAKMTSVPEGKHAVQEAKQLGKEFISEFAN